ncbi:glutathione S-transferase family protein [Celeribacter persicus]|uniref:Glutathione S-transferase n=1 Tax=Celeribacter persicus TaxID=1651082 RepID=A0A2T5HSI3_9RHOB|nr:glutathione S-transferase family protein [Celeribacter persicus]PTQ74550.1 glutathione S-transferase [Celeribacter persicus]
MLTLHHAPNSRSSRIVTLLIALDVLDQVEIRLTDIPRQDGSGARDPNNPHPEGKVPLLITEEGEMIRESNAILLYLSDRFPSEFAPQVGEPGRGAYLSWLFWYGNVLEPVYIHHLSGLSHRLLDITFRGMPEAVACLAAGLEGRDFLLGDHYTVADLLIASPFLWFSEATPDVPVIRDWVARCAAQPCIAQSATFDAKAAQEMGLSVA